MEHFEAAESKRNSIDKEIAKSIDWGNRMVAQMMLNKINPVILLPRGACTVPPLDADLDPSKLWKEAVQLSNNGQYEDAAWKFLLALFLDAALDANDLKPARKAVRGCKPDDPVAMALSTIVCWKKKEPLKRGVDMVMKAESMDHSFDNCELAESIEDVDRTKFGLGCCRIMYARMLTRVFNVTSIAQSFDRKYLEEFDEAANRISEAQYFIDPNRWLTIQFELGYIAMDAGAATEAKYWFRRFITNLAVMRTENDGKLSKHWEMLLARAKRRQLMIPQVELEIILKPLISILPYIVYAAVTCLLWFVLRWCVTAILTVVRGLDRSEKL